MNPHEGNARLRKALRLADHLDAYRITAAKAASLTAGQRLDVATSAGVKLPSDATWALVVEALERRELHRARAENAILAAVPADPFQGLMS
jgi:hypothetical protein